MQEITITISLRSDGDYEYNIYDVLPDDSSMLEIDGGICTAGTLEASFDMAVAHTKQLLKVTNN